MINLIEVYRFYRLCGPLLKLNESNLKVYKYNTFHIHLIDVLCSTQGYFSYVTAANIRVGGKPGQQAKTQDHPQAAADNGRPWRKVT